MSPGGALVGLAVTCGLPVVAGFLMGWPYGLLALFGLVIGAVLVLTDYFALELAVIRARLGRRHHR
jgi:hypothetical protein